MLVVTASPSLAAGPATGLNTSLVSIVANAHPVVIFTLLLLLFFSVTTWTIIFVKFRQLRQAMRRTTEFVDAFWNSKSLSQIYRDLGEFAGSPVANVFQVAYSEMGRLSKVASGLGGSGSGELPITGLDNLNRSLNQACRAEMRRLSRYLSFLATTGNTAPFVGLFGTVVGIMNAFHGIGAVGSASLATVAPGISEALVATAAGLAAAIPAVVAYNHFLSKIRGLEAEMNAFASELMNLVERDALRKGKAVRAA